MDITTLAAWGEFLGGIAVVVSLVYLAPKELEWPPRGLMVRMFVGGGGKNSS
jgi:hypothetical protein